MSKLISPNSIFAQILANRGLTSSEQVEHFLHPKYERDQADPFLLTDMNLAVARISVAIEAGEDIVIYGDYDIDGLTASVVMLETLRAMGGRARSYIPDRFEEGYGINLAALKKLKKQGCSLVVSVDCGITSKSEIAWAMGHGLDVIVTDHHAVPTELPEAVAVVNPKRVGDKYPFKDLAGVGVAFKLICALQIEGRAHGRDLFQSGQEKWLLDLVALGTVCDVVSLTGENRVLAHYGLMVMQKTRRPGLIALAGVAEVSLAQLRAYHLGFVFGPRLNAAGRLEHAAKSLELLMTDDPKVASQVAEQLNALNRQRQSDQQRIVEEATEQAKHFSDDVILVLANKSWSHGIVGIVASKLVEKYHKPTLVMQVLGETAKGSARSIGDYNMVESLRATEALLIRHGGHHFAAGYTLNTKDIDLLRRTLNANARAQGITTEFEAQVHYDVELEDFTYLDYALYELLVLLEPLGSGNPKPLFKITSLTISTLRWVGQSANHAKLTLSDSVNQSFSAIFFNAKEKFPDIVEGGDYGAICQLDNNEFNGNSSLQLIIEQFSE
ncbi:MAG: single-stranded-DNA-specific exonuclease RecJ [Candidatus Saccharimonadia bacterium]